MIFNHDQRWLWNHHWNLRPNIVFLTMIREGYGTLMKCLIPCNDTLPPQTQQSQKNFTYLQFLLFLYKFQTWVLYIYNFNSIITSFRAESLLFTDSNIPWEALEWRFTYSLFLSHFYKFQSLTYFLLLFCYCTFQGGVLHIYTLYSKNHC